jgi:hypothetical protein
MEGILRINFKKIHTNEIRVEKNANGFVNLTLREENGCLVSQKLIGQC